MADTATEFLLKNLKELLVNHPNLIKDDDTRGNIENLQRDLIVLKAFLRDTVKMRITDERTKELVKAIHDIVYQLQDIIDVFVTKTFEKNHKTRFFRFWKNAGSLHRISKIVEAIKVRAERFREETNILPSLEKDEDEKSQRQLPRTKDVTGFIDMREDMIHRLTQETDYFDVISLIGMFGLGKTTLARMIFSARQIVYKFSTRIWLPISQQFTAKEVFLDILKEFTTINEDMRAIDEHELADMVAARLQKESFLIVMDDVWSGADWERLSVALPFHNTKGKVLITSRNEEVGEVASKPRPIYRLRFFTCEESWMLLRLEALGRLECPPQLEDVGRMIAENCDGLPNAIVVIGGILAELLGTNMDTTRRKWIEVSRQLTSYLNERDHTRRMQKLISLNYDYLPYHLRACFLYLGLFPEDHEIPVSKLIRMWIAEGFVQQQINCSLEETGERYLEDLINRNLIRSVKFKPDGKVKTCQIHDTLRDFCLNEAATEYLLQETWYNSDGTCVPPISSIGTYRCLSVHSNCLSFISSRPFCPRVRSFVCFSKSNYVVSPENSTNIIGAFKLVRVLDVMPLKFTKIDSDLYNLVHMRYIAFSSELSILPSKFNQLWNIQTLIVDTKSRTLQVKADIWKMKHLRHFKTNASATLPKPTKSHKQSTQLQTLGLISAESCTEELPDQAPNLKKLGIRGRLALLFDTRNGSFDSMGKMRQLGKLKLINDAYPIRRREGALGCLPGYDRFPYGLTSLTICATFLSWEHMSTLGLLEKLEVLKLKDHAFVGETWQAKDGGFHSLETLYIEQTDLAFWKASSHHYPRLKSLVLKSCDKLCEIPIELADIPSFEMMELYICIYAAKSARKISKRKTQAEGSSFMLSIYPLTE